MTENQLVLRSTVSSDGQLEVAVVSGPIPEPGPEDVVIRVEASPINPSDLGMLLAGADLSKATRSESSMLAPIPERALGGLAGRFDAPMPVGNEGAGEVVAAGSADLAQSLLGKTVAVVAGGMYGQYRKVPAASCLVLNSGTTAVEAASCFVNPLTALGMVDTMRSEGHSALVHTAAASNLGQMLQRICIADGVDLVNIVRRPEHVEMLESQGATWVCDSSSTDFESDLTEALKTTGATIAFDAVGGGELASTILSCMERAANVGSYSRYGSDTSKQVYIYGGLNRSRTTLDRTYGMAWSLGGWLLTPFLAKAGPERGAELRQRVADEINTTFASSYTATISLSDIIDPEIAGAYAAMATGEKYLVAPHL